MKDTRINLRIPTAEKEAWEQAATTYGLTLTEFVTRSVRGTMLSLASAKTRSTASFGADVSVAYARFPDGTQPQEDN